MQSTHLLGAAELWKSYATIADDLDLLGLSAASEVSKPGWPGGRPCAFIYVGGTGDIVATPTVNGNPSVDEKILHVVAGTWLPIRATAIKASGTTATNITIFWN